MTKKTAIIFGGIMKIAYLCKQLYIKTKYNN